MKSYPETLITLNYVRSRYWVTRGRQSVIQGCVIYLKQNSKPFRTLPAAPLPHYRFNINFLFSCTGIDNLAPLHVMNIFTSGPNELLNVYIPLYACGSTRAVYLNLLPDASSRSFVNNFKRFIARHDTPKHFISDNLEVLWNLKFKTIFHMLILIGIIF